MAFGRADRDNLFLNRKGNVNEWELDRLSDLGDYLAKMNLISEVTSLPDEFFSGINQAVIDSKFWDYDNDFIDTTVSNLGHGIYAEQTDAAEILGSALQNFFELQDFPITVSVISLDPEADKDKQKLTLPVGKGHKLYPNGIVAGGQQSIENGRFVMYLFLASVDESFNPGDVNPSAIAGKVSRMVRHELVHSKQFEKRRRKQKISRQTAKDRYEAEGEIPPEGAPRTQYLGAGIEIDAYTHEFAEELLELFGKNRTLDIISRKFSPDELKKLGLSDTLVEYLEEYGSEQFTKKLRSKIYTQVMDMTSRGLYEGSATRQEDILRRYVSGLLRETLNDDDLIIKKSPINGVGVFANKFIPANTDLGPAQILVTPESYEITQLGKHHNHSYDPSCYNDWLGNERHLFSRNDLVSGDEVTIDYTQQPDLEQPKDDWS